MNVNYLVAVSNMQDREFNKVQNEGKQIFEYYSYLAFVNMTNRDRVNSDLITCFKNRFKILGRTNHID